MVTRNHNKGGLPNWQKERRAQAERFATLDDSQLLDLSRQFAREVKNAKPGSLSDGSSELRATVNIIKDRVQQDGLEGHKHFTSLVNTFSHMNHTELGDSKKIADAVLSSEPSPYAAVSSLWRKFLPGQNQS